MPDKANSEITKRLAKQDSKKQEWASLFATISPVEDFVETYKMAALNQAQAATDPGTSQSFGPLTSYLFYLGTPALTTSYDLVSYLTDPTTTLYAKAACATSQ